MRWNSGKWIQLVVSDTHTHIIPRSLHFQIKKSDKSTKMCVNCFRSLHRYDQYRKLCVAKNREMTREETSDAAIAGISSEVTANSVPDRLASSEAVGISLPDDETDSEKDVPASVSKRRSTRGKVATISSVAVAKRRSTCLNSAESAK